MKCIVGKQEKTRQIILVLFTAPDDIGTTRKGVPITHISATEAREWIMCLEKAIKRLERRKLGEGRP